MSYLLFHVAVEPVQIEGVGWAGAWLLTQNFSEEREKKLHSLTAGHEHDQFLPILKLRTYKQSVKFIFNLKSFNCFICYKTLRHTVSKCLFTTLFNARILYLAFGQNEGRQTDQVEFAGHYHHVLLQSLRNGIAVWQSLSSRLGTHPSRPLAVHWHVNGHWVLHTDAG